MVVVMYLMWFLPVLLIPLSFVSFRIKTFRKPRNLIYVIILFSGFILNLTSMSFKNDSFDTIINLLITFVLCEFFWYFSKIRNKILVRILFIGGIVLFVATYKDWLVGGPKRNQRYWSTVVENKYNNNKKTYKIKEEKKYGLWNMKRNFTLYIDVIPDLMEKQIRSYCVPEGYNNAQFRFHWAWTPKGIKVDLIGNTDTLWSLGEGL